jgi:acetate kinase
MHNGDGRVKLVFDLFVDRIMGHIGNDFAKLGGKVDALTFPEGLGRRARI